MTLCLAIVLLLGYMYEPFAQNADAKAYPPPGKMIDVGGYNLHLHCKGTGNPTVIIDAGWGEWSTMWRNIQDIVAKHTQICAYDRAGMGWSDVGPQPRDAKQFSKELHTLLHKAGITSPYVLAGHSLGGFTVRVYAHEYPSDVSGVVLIDSMSPKQFTTSARDVHQSNTPQYSSVISLLGRLGIVRITSHVIDSITQAPNEDHSTKALHAHSKFLQSYLDEGAGLPESAFQASQVTSFGDIPLIVLTAGKENTSFASWNKMQTELLQLSSNSKQVIAETSGHNIHIDQPEAAVDAITTMIKLIVLKKFTDH